MIEWYSEPANLSNNGKDVLLLIIISIDANIFQILVRIIEEERLA